MYLFGSDYDLDFQLIFLVIFGEGVIVSFVVDNLGLFLTSVENVTLVARSWTNTDFRVSG